MKEKIKFHLLPICLLTLIGIAVYHIWFTNLAPITWGDWYIGYKENSLESFGLPYLWNLSEGIGNVNLGIFFWPFDGLIAGLLANLGVNIYLGERIIFLWPVAVLSLLSMYALGYYVLRSRLGAIISSFVFSFNLYSIILSQGHLTLRMANIFSLFLLLFYIKSLKEKKLVYSVVAGLFAFIVSFYEFRIYYLSLWLLAFYSLFHIFVVDRIFSFKGFASNILFASIPVIISLLLNLYGFLGLYHINYFLNSSIISKTLFGSSYIRLAKLLTIFQHDWTGGKPTGIIQPIPIRFFFLPVFVYLGLIFNRKRKLVVFFGIVALLGTFFTKLTAFPFPHVYEWFFTNAPGFQVFRESGKFGLYTIIGYSILIGGFSTYIYQNFGQGRFKFLSYLIVGFVAFLFLVNTKPIFSLEFGQLLIPRRVPPDYLIVKDFLYNQPEYFRTYWTPTFSRWSAYRNIHPRISEFSIYNNQWSSLGNLDLKPKILNNMLNLSSVKYVFIPLEDHENEANLFEYLGKRSFYLNKLNNFDFLRKINIGTKKIVAYENKNYRPHIYLTYQKESIKKSIPYQKVNFRYKNQTEYTFSLKSINEPVYIQFSEAYHPDWRLRLGDLTWYKVISDKDYFLPDKFHTKNEAFLNSFYLYPEYIKKTFPDSFYKINPDGSLDLNFTLYFRPQSYVYLGLIVSISVFIICIVYLSYVSVVKLKDLRAKK